MRIARFTSAGGVMGVLVLVGTAMGNGATVAEVRETVADTLGGANSASMDHVHLSVASLNLDTQPGDTTPPAGGTPAGSGGAPKPSDSGQNELALKANNPIANLISVPIQFNWDTGIGPGDDEDQIKVNIQPVIPVKLPGDWLMISRTILPVIYQEGPAAGISSEFGIGDTLQSLFFTPPAKDLGGTMLGFGPAMLFPTGTDDLFRSKQFSAGPTAVVLRIDPLGEGSITYGMLMNHLWKVAGSDDNPSTNATFLQPFVGYTLKSGTSFFLNSESTYNWTESDWSVPLNLMFNQVVAFGKQPVQFSFGGRYYVETVPDGPDWGIRFAVTFLFPQ